MRVLRQKDHCLDVEVPQDFCSLSMRVSLSKDERKIIYGKLNYVDWVMIRIAYNPNFEIDSIRFIKKCVKCGYLDILKMIDIEDYDFLQIVFKKAIKYGKIEILKWFNRNGILNTMLLEI